VTEPIGNTHDVAADPPRWCKADTPRLPPSATADEALARIVRSGVSHLRGNEACVRARAHEEGVHQMRVAVRRLRSVLALYRPYIPAEQQRYLNSELRWLIGELGPARDWDVFVEETIKPVSRQMPEEDRLALLREHVEVQRDQAYARAQAAIGDHRYLGLVLLLDAWAEGRRWNEAYQGHDRHRNPLQASAVSLANLMLEEHLRNVLAAGEGFEHLSAAERHKVRIQIKKLRYASEFFTSLYRRRAVEPFLAAMKTLQADLGLRNDIEVARTLLKKVVKASGGGREKAQLAYGAGLVVGWHSHLSDNAERKLVAEWHRFVERAPFWHRPPRMAEEPPPAGTEASTVDSGQPEPEPAHPIAPGKAPALAAAASPAAAAAPGSVLH
jgi:CHAD domain-containing protein